MENRSSFVDLYENGFAPVYRAALVLSGDRYVAEEATQEAFARAFERWSRIRGEPWAVGWVMTTALNTVRRTRSRRSEKFAMTPGVIEHDSAGSIDLWVAIRSLPPRQQEAITLHYIADLPLVQVAKVMKCQNGTVKAHLWRARQELARQMRVADDG